MAQISKITLPDSATYGIRAGAIPFGKVDSTSTATAFTATVEGITELVDGACCYLMNGVVTSASGWTLNVNGLGAKPVYQTLAAATVTTTIFNINYTMLFVYNSTRVEGGCWDIFYGYNSNTTYSNASLGQGYATCSTAASTAAKTASLSSYSLTTGGIVAVKFTNAVPANATLNVNSKGAKAIYFRGAKITAGIINAGDIAYFIYSTYYYLLGVDRSAMSLPASSVTNVGTGTSVVGTSANYARQDHQHAISSSTIASALGYTPYDSSNPSGYITDAGVTSFNGSTGAVTYTAPVTSVNGNTGAVTVSVPSAGTTVHGVSSTGSAGTADTWSRSDHAHALSSSTIATVLGYTPAANTVATQNANGLMSSSDKTKLDNISTSGQVQANWNETDTTAASYIQNKPTIPTSVSELTNDSGYLTTSTMSIELEDSVPAILYYILGSDSALSLGATVQQILSLYTSAKKVIFARVLSATQMRAFTPAYIDQSTGTLGLMSVDDEYVYWIELTPSQDGTTMEGTQTTISLAEKHPVGSVYVTNTNVNPSSYLGGTWSLFDKQFAATSGNASFTRNTTNFSSITLHVTREGHNLTFSGTATSAVSISNTNLEVLTQTLSSNGSSYGSSDNITFIGQCDSANAIVLMDIDGDGRMRTLNVVVRGTGTSIASGSVISFNVTIPCSAGDLVDSFCDKFYWKRTA